MEGREEDEAEQLFGYSIKTEKLAACVHTYPLHAKFSWSITALQSLETLERESGRAGTELQERRLCGSIAPQHVASRVSDEGLRAPKQQ